MTPTVTREVAEGIARMLTGEGLDDAMEFDGDTIVIRDLGGGEPDEYITPDHRGHYSFGFIGWCFCWDEGPATYGQEANR